MKILLLFILFPVLVSAQQPVDCSQIKSPGCKAFNELLGSRDPDIADKLKRSGSTTYACFYPHQGRFYLLSFNHPSLSNDLCSATRQTGCFPEEKALLEYDVFGGGVLYDSEFVWFEWRKGVYGLTGTSDGVAQDTGDESAEDMHVYIYPTELGISQKYLNENDQRAIFTLRLRRDTGQFVQTVEPEDGKAFVARSMTGDCTELRPEKVAMPPAT
jgi:hypothetical protein